MDEGIFDTIIDRKGSGAVKWDLAEKLYGPGDVLPMWVADMDFAAPGAVLRALTERVEHPVFGYTMVGEGLIRAVSGRMRRLYGWETRADELIFMPGVVPSMANAVRAFSEPGEGVILQPPVYPPFSSMVREAGRRVVENPLRQAGDGRWEIDLEDLERKAKDARLLLFCSPHNPVGRVWTRDELEALLDIALRHDLIVVSDEIHAEIVYPEAEHIPFAALNGAAAARAVTCVAASKTFNVAGLAASVAIIGERALHKRFKSSLGALTGEPNLFGLTALEAAFSRCDLWLDELLRYLDGNRRLTADFIRAECPGIRCTLPEATFLAWLDCRQLGMDDAGLARFFASEARVGLNPGVSFGSGGEGFMRMNFGTPRALLEEGLERIAGALSRE
jgi:cysteine-S-conjugate beta-lyase